MTPPIHGRFTWTDDEFAACRRAIRGASRSPVNRVFLVAAVLFGTVLFGTLIALALRPPRHPRDLLIFVVAVAGFLFLVRKAIYKSAASEFHTLIPELARDVDWTIDEEGLSMRSPGGERSTFWPMIETIDEADEGFLFRIQSGASFHWLPKSSFDEPRDVERLRLFIKERRARADKTIDRNDLI